MLEERKRNEREGFAKFGEDVWNVLFLVMQRNIGADICREATLSRAIISCSHDRSRVLVSSSAFGMRSL